MTRLCVQKINIGGFYQVTKIHHRYGVRDVLHNAQIMCDEKIGQSKLILKTVKKVKHLSLNRYIKGGYWLITDDELGFKGKSTGYAYALTLTSRELMWITIDMLRIEAYGLKELFDLSDTLRLAPLMMDDQWLTDKLTDSHPGIEGCLGILEDDLCFSSEIEKIASFESGYIMALKIDGSTGGVYEADDASSDSGLSTSGFPHQSHGLATFY